MVAALTELSSPSLTKKPTILVRSSLGTDNRSCASTSLEDSVAVHVNNELLWHALDDATVEEELATSPSQGLSREEAAERLKTYGPNCLTPPKKPGWLRKIWGQVNNVLTYILFGAAVVEGILQAWAEFALVLGVIVINTAIGLIQEGKAEKAAEAIKAMLSPSALVVREGEQVLVPADELVPGDIVMLKSGDKVPADMRLLKVSNLQVQEAMLTGESLPVSKHLQPSRPSASLGDRKCMCYSATSVVSGRGCGVVVATGDNAEIGKINKMVNTVESTRNNLLYQLEILGRWLAILVAVVAVVAFLLALFAAHQGFQKAFESAVSIAVATIPEGLPAIVTIVLAIGTTVMARNNAIIRQLPAVETLGSLNVVCSDKTGTLTKNEMTAVMIRTSGCSYKISGVGYAPQGGFSVCGELDDEARDVREVDMAGLRGMLEGLVLCNDSSLSKMKDEATGQETYTPMGAPTEVALLTLGYKAGLDAKVLAGSKQRLGSVPFESQHKFMATVHEEGGCRVLYVKGAPDRLLPLCDSEVVGDNLRQRAPLNMKMWQVAQAEMSSKGLRVLALCRAELPDDEDLSQLSPENLLGRGPWLTLVMMVAILDPPRPEAIESVQRAHKAGITVKMITGDHSLTALAIGRMLGIEGTGQVLTGTEVDSCSQEDLTALVKECNIFARASPENKLRIVRALQECHQVVAMTGDGVNDAPALKAADVGVAMGITGTDVSKEAAQMVLADDNFASIIAAVVEGRRVWDNIRKILVFNLPINMAQGTSVLYAYILGLEEPPLTALQVLLINLVTSVTLGLALAAEPVEPDVMTRPPRRVGKRLVGKLLMWRMFFVCHIIVSLVIGMFYWGAKMSLDLEQRRAEAFCIMVGAQVAYFVNCRFLKASSFHPRVFRGNTTAYYSVLITLGLMVFLIYTPEVNAFFNMEGMVALQWVRAVVCMVIVYGVVEVEKALVDPLLMPLIRPVLRWMGNHIPDCLSMGRPPLPLRNYCRKEPRTLSRGECVVRVKKHSPDWAGG